MSIDSVTTAIEELEYYAAHEIDDLESIRRLMGGKTFHSIGHLPGSRTGPADHHLSEQEASLFTSRWENSRERVVVTEKLDGTCVGIQRLQHCVVPVNRAGYLVWKSPYEMHHRFAVYVRERMSDFIELLKPGERLVGEWMAQAHGIIYDSLPDLFFAFDLWSDGRWVPTMELIRSCTLHGVQTVPLISYGPPLDPAYYKRLTKRSAFRSSGVAEGLVFRRENDQRRLAIAKWVRSDVSPGVYLPELEGSLVSEPVWHQVYEERNA